MPINQQELVSELSSSRLQPYRRLGGVPNTLAAIESMYLLNEVSQHLYVPLQLVEVALRNRISAVIKKWSNRDDWYLHIPCTAKSQSAVQEAIRLASIEVRGRAPSHDDVLCRLMFGFWAYMLDKPYRNSKQKGLYIWDQFRIRDAFPGMPRNLTIGALHSRLIEMNDLRNRLFHHEPIWKSQRVASIEDAMHVISGKHEQLCDVLKWLSPEQAGLLSGWGFHGRFNKAIDVTRLGRKLW